MTTQNAEDASRLQPKNRSNARAARDVSINDYAWAANPRIYGNSIFSQTTTCVKGALDTHVCPTA
jgi:hypothetical protein